MAGDRLSTCTLHYMVSRIARCRPHRGVRPGKQAPYVRDTPCERIHVGLPLIPKLRCAACELALDISGWRAGPPRREASPATQQTRSGSYEVTWRQCRSDDIVYD